MSLASIIEALRASGLKDIVLRELTGNNLPHVALVRNKNEFVDQSISQFGNTAAYFGSGLLLNKLFDVIATRVLPKTLTPQATQWLHLGKTLGIFGFISPLLFALPFLRNYITTKRTQTTHYADMIGEKAKQSSNKDDLKALLKTYVTRFAKTVLLGVGLSTTLFTSALLVAKRKNPIPLPKVLAFFNRHLGLENGRFEKLPDAGAIAFWVIPTFSGFLSAARDLFEVKELALRFAAFNLAFFAFPKTVEKGIEYLAHRMKNHGIFKSAENVAYAGKFASSLVFCSAVPTVVNIYLTHQRIKHEATLNNPLKNLILAHRAEPLNRLLHAQPQGALPRPMVESWASGVMAY